MLQWQPNVLAVLISSTTTQTTTSSVTLTGAGQTTQYETLTQLSSVQTVTGTTYTTNGVTTVMGQILTTGFHPVTVVTYTQGTSCDTASQCVHFITTQCYTVTAGCVGWIRMITLTYNTPRTGYVAVYAKSTVYGTVTSQYVTSVPTTVVSTSASTSTFATSQVVAVTATQTLTSVSEQSFSEMLSQNWWVLLVVGAVVLAVLAFSLGRGSRSGPASQTVQGPKPGMVYCVSCGAQNPATGEFCGKCGTKL